MPEARRPRTREERAREEAAEPAAVPGKWLCRLHRLWCSVGMPCFECKAAEKKGAS